MHRKRNFINIMSSKNCLACKSRGVKKTWGKTFFFLKNFNFSDTNNLNLKFFGLTFFSKKVRSFNLYSLPLGLCMPRKTVLSMGEKKYEKMLL